MANEESLIREVDEGLAEDHLTRALRERTPLLVGGAALIVAAVAGYQFYTAQKAGAASSAAHGYHAVLSDETAGPEERETALDLFVEDAPGGYAALARLRLAASQAAAGERAEALANYRAIADDSRLTKRMRDLASVRAAHLALADSRSAVIEAVGALETDTSPLGFFAREVLGVAALQDGDYQTAESIFQDIANAEDAPSGVKRRAEEFAALAVTGSANGALEWPDLEAGSSISPALDALGGDLSGILKATDNASSEAAAPVTATEETSEAAAPASETASDQTPANETADDETAGSETAAGETTADETPAEDGQDEPRTEASQ